MRRFFRPTWAEVHLGALQENLRRFRRRMPRSTKVLFVVKGETVRAYATDGHRAVEALGAAELDPLGEGEWTVNAAKELGVDVRVIEDSLQVRRESADPKNQNKYSNKIVALLRKQFGGHGIQKK